MTLLIVSVLLVAYLLLASERFTNINKAAVAVFAAAAGWVLYICWGSDYVMSRHGGEYMEWLNGATATSAAVKDYIAANIFLRYVGRAAEVVLFLLSTIAIVDVLSINGCFDFFQVWMRTRKSRKYLWMLSVFSLLLSANLDNLTTSVMMVAVMMKVVSQHRYRLVYGSAIVVSANFGGAMTVIGDPLGLVVWNMSAVSASGLFLRLVIPCLVAWAVTVFLLSRMLPDRMDADRQPLPFRGDDTRLNVGQRVAMLIVGIGGLWFIPTFHSITHLSPFLGALCVLSVLWIVNEIFNRNLPFASSAMADRARTILGSQTLLYVMGMMLAVGVVQEIGVASWLTVRLGDVASNVWLIGAMAGVLSMIIDNMAVGLTFFTLHEAPAAVDADIYWPVIIYFTTFGGNLLLIGSMSGLAFAKLERVSIAWYARKVLPKVMLGGAIGAAVLMTNWVLYKI